MKKECLYCGGDIEKKSYESKRFFLEKRIYCSYVCKNQARPTKHWAGKKFTQEHKDKISEKSIFWGDSNPNWSGGRTPLVMRIRNSCFSRQWRSDVFTRDNFTCQECGLRGCKLEAHHIKSFSEIVTQYEIETYEKAIDCDELWNINNGITLCKECHSKTDSYKGKNKNKVTKV